MKIDPKTVERLKYHVYKLSHEIGDRSVFEYDKLEKAVRYIKKEFSSYGYNVELQEYNIAGKKVQNIIISKYGKGQRHKTVIVGAHYDTCSNPGADDNASAVAVLLELAGFMKDRETNCTVKFIGFVNEEPPFYRTEDMGSRIYTKDARYRKEDIKGALILEMVGYYSEEHNSQRYPPFLAFFYPNKGNFIGVVGNTDSRYLVKSVASSFKRHSHFPIESIVVPGSFAGADFSDNWSFWKEGYPAVMITDTGFYRNPNYHSNSDTYDTLNYDYMAEVVKGLQGVLTELAK